VAQVVVFHIRKLSPAVLYAATSWNVVEDYLVLTASLEGAFSQGERFQRKHHMFCKRECK
jgi:hypothetical protein